MALIALAISARISLSSPARREPTAPRARPKTHAAQHTLRMRNLTATMGWELPPAGRTAGWNCSGVQAGGKRASADRGSQTLTSASKGDVLPCWRCGLIVLPERASSVTARRRRHAVLDRWRLLRRRVSATRWRL